MGSRFSLQTGKGLLSYVSVFLQRHSPELALECRGLCDVGKSLEMLTSLRVLRLYLCFRTHSLSRNDTLDLKMEMVWLSDPPCVHYGTVWTLCPEVWTCPLPLFWHRTYSYLAETEQF